ncbi:MAG: outer membrane beta-barrel protein [Opitutales bacterium]
MIFLRFIVLSLFCSSPLIPLMGQTNELSVEARLANLKARSRSHENEVAQLLSQPSIQKTDFSLPVPSVTPPPVEQIEPPRPSYIPVPEPVSPSPGIVREVQSSTRPLKSNAEGNPQVDLDGSKDIEQAYRELYTPKVPNRIEGYYFGPILGLVLSKDGAVREGLSKNDYSSDSGFLLGVQVGKDFGDVRAEVEYAYISFDASTSNRGSLSASIHNFFTRLILEKELGDRFDLRAGIGMGVGIVGLEDSADYNGAGFAYDFILGAGYRLAENLSLQLDYRYYLTAANDGYDHMKGHIWLLSAGLDL